MIDRRRGGKIEKGEDKRIVEESEGGRGESGEDERVNEGRGWG